MHDAVATAQALLRQRRRREKLVAPLADGLRPVDPAQGAAAQFALAGLVDAVPPGGFKIGATSRVMQEYLGLPGPSAGFMRADDLHASGAALPFGDYLNPGTECELAVRLARDIPAGPIAPVAAWAAVGDFFAAMEVVEQRYGDVAVLGTPTLIADQFYHAAAVLGAPAAMPGDLLGIRGRILVDGVERGAGVSADLLGGPAQALAWLAASETVAAFGGLRAGQVVMLGSVTPPIWLDGPCEVRVEFEGLAAVTLALTSTRA